ncbi:MAG: hypothetical protein FWG80_00430 [Alphaproteobacteria bacterium]|nr:hypothetical protein [Alphaproteobacteria bacterium]
MKIKNLLKRFRSRKKNAIIFNRLEAKLDYLTRCFGIHGLDRFTYETDIFINKNGGEYFPNYIRPQSLMEYILHIIVNYYERSPIKWILRHKFLAKQFVQDIVGDEHIVKLYGVYDWPEQIDFDKLPNSFVLKATVGWQSKQVIIIKDKSKMDKKETLAKLNEFIRDPATGILDFTKNRIIAEEYLENPDGTPVEDLKFMCSMGNVFLVAVHQQIPDVPVMSKNKTISYYSVPDYKYIPVKHGLYNNKQAFHPSYPNIPQPKNFDKVIALAKKITANLPFVRLDLYSVGDRILVGELTWGASGGHARLSPAKYDFELGKNIKFPDNPKDIDEWIARDIAKYGEIKDLI